MGTDNIHHRKQAKSFERRKGTKEPALRYLIVCEGEKTEPHYFKELRHSLRLRSATVEVCGKECGSDPVSVFNYAKKLFDEEKNISFDAVYCVIDKDDHKNFDKAVKLIADIGSPFNAVISYPCFEYWLLLHFDLVRNSFFKTPTKSVGDVVHSALRRYDKAYSKGSKGVWQRYHSMLPTAMANAEIMKKAANATGNPNPSTDLHLLVNALVNLEP